MKKQVLLGTALFAAIGAFSQQGRVRTQAAGIFDVRHAKIQAIKAGVNESAIVSPMIGSGQITGGPYGRPASQPTAVSWQLLCGSMNVNGMLVSSSRPLQYNPNVNAVSFIHRKSATYQESPGITSAAKSGVIVAEISTNWGNTWDSTAIWADPVQWGRYPQGAIYSPPNNTNVSNAYVVGSGPTVSGSAFTGNWFGSKKLNTFNATASTAPGAQQFLALGLSSYPSHLKENGWSRTGFTSTDDGLVRSLGIVEGDYQGLTTVQGFAVTTGTFNTTSNTFDWRVDTVLPPCIIGGDGEKHLNPDPQMAFNQSGTVGYIVGIGALSSSTLANMGYQPIVYKIDMTQTSPTWSLVSGIDFNSSTMRPVVRSRFNSRFGLAGLQVLGSDTVGVPFVDDYDIAVDNNGKLHIGATIMSTASDHPDSLNFISQFTTSINPGEEYKWRHVNGSRPYLYDFIGDGSGSWNYVLVDSISSEGPSASPGFPGYNDNPWDPADQSLKVGMDSRIQLGRTPSGSHIIFSWVESDTSFTNSAFKWNSLPDIKARMMSIGSGTSMYVVDNGPEQNMTANDPNVQVRATLHYMSPTSSAAMTMTGSATHTIDVKMPFTVTNSNPYSQTTNNATWYGGANLTFVFKGSGVSNPGTPVGINEKVETFAGSYIFPNPARNLATLAMVLENSTPVSIDVMNAIGQSVKSTRVQGHTGENKIAVDLSGLSSGIYLVNIKAANESTTKKLIVE